MAIKIICGLLFLSFILLSCVPQHDSETGITVQETQPSQTEPISNSGQQSLTSLPGPGYAEVIDADNGVVAWLSRDKIIQIVNIENPQSPILAKTVSTPGFTEGISWDNNYFYLTDTKEFQIRELADASPTSTFRLDGFWPEAFTVQDNHAYIVSGNQLMILDISNQKNIKKVSQTTLTGMAPSDIIVSNGYAYAVQTLGGLNIINIQNPAAPKIVHVIPFESHTVGFRMKGNTGYLGRITSLKQGKEYEFQSTFEILDFTNPSNPSVIGSVEIPTNIKGLDVSDNHAYIIGGTYPYRFVTIDISSPNNPKLLKTADNFAGSAEFQDILVEGSNAYLADGMAGLRILDLSGKQIAEINLQGRAFKLKKYGDSVYAIVEQKYFNVADVLDPEKPLISYTEVFTASYPYTSIVVQNNKVYVKTDEFKIYDISDPSHPRKINEKSIEVDSIQVQENYLYSTIGEIGLLVFDVSNPKAPSQVSVTPFTGIPRDVKVDGRWAVGITNIPYSVNVLDISNPVQPVSKGSYAYSKYPDSVWVIDNYIYVARGSEGLDILKISLDGSPAFIKNIKKDGYTHSVTAQGNTLVVVREGIDIYDITNPEDPLFLRHQNTANEANNAAIDGNAIYVADGYAGIAIIHSEQAEEQPSPAPSIPETKNTNAYTFHKENGITFEHYWPLDPASPYMKNDESEIMVYNEGNKPVHITATYMVFFLDGKSYDIYSGTWEKFPSRTSWERAEYINIGKNHYNGEPLILKPGEKGKIHYHYKFDATTSKNQEVRILLTYTVGGNEQNIDQTLDRTRPMIEKTENTEEHGGS